MQNTTIAAIATAPGAGGIAVVRLSGPESYAVAARVFHPANPNKNVEEAKGYTALFGSFVEGDDAFDEGVALFFREPHSYTGEDVWSFPATAAARWPGGWWKPASRQGLFRQLPASIPAARSSTAK